MDRHVILPGCGFHSTWTYSSKLVDVQFRKGNQVCYIIFNIRMWVQNRPSLVPDDRMTWSRGYEKMFFCILSSKTKAIKITGNLLWCIWRNTDFLESISFGHILINHISQFPTDFRFSDNFLIKSVKPNRQIVKTRNSWNL